MCLVEILKYSGIEDLWLLGVFKPVELEAALETRSFGDFTKEVDFCTQGPLLSKKEAGVEKKKAL